MSHLNKKKKKSNLPYTGTTPVSIMNPILLRFDPNISFGLPYQKEKVKKKAFFYVQIQ